MQGSVSDFPILDGTSTNTNGLASKCNTKHSGESDPLSRAQAGLGTDEVRRVARAPMGTKEGGAGPGDGATGAAQHLRRNDSGSPTIMDYRSMARHLQFSERRFWVVQPDGGPPRRVLHAPSRPQGQIFCGRLPEQPTATASRVSGPDCPPGQANPGDDHDRKHDLWGAGWRQGGRLGRCLPGYGATTGKGGWENQTHPHLPIPISPVRRPGTTNGRQRAGLPNGQGDGRIPDHPGSGFAARNGRR